MRRGMFVGLAVGLLLAGSSVGAGAATANHLPTRAVAAAASLPRGLPFFLVRANGKVDASRTDVLRGDARHVPLAQPMTGIATTPTGDGYWLVAADGGVFSFGDAHFYGSTAGRPLNAPIVGIAATKDGRGYWLVASDGGVFTFGDARFFESLAGHRLNQPVIGITATRSGKGYRLLGRDGGVFTFGDATFEGSLGGRGFSDAIGLAPTPSGHGYWILRKAGATYPSCVARGCPSEPSSPVAGPSSVVGPSVDNFGDARKLFGPNFVVPGTSGHPMYDSDFTRDPVVAIVANPAQQGYYVLREDSGRYGWAGELLRP
jgi:hypothetical protein